jgi:hypothetical protein
LHLEVCVLIHLHFNCKICFCLHKWVCLKLLSNKMVIPVTSLCISFFYCIFLYSGWLYTVWRFQLHMLFCLLLWWMNGFQRSYLESFFSLSMVDDGTWFLFFLFFLRFLLIYVVIPFSFQFSFRSSLFCCAVNCSRIFYFDNFIIAWRRGKWLWPVFK